MMRFASPSSSTKAAALRSCDRVLRRTDRPSKSSSDAPRHAPADKALRWTHESRSKTRARAKSASRRPAFSRFWRCNCNFVGPNQFTKRIGKFHFLIPAERVDLELLFEPDDEDGKAQRIQTN
jgi:hypothetical protein